MQKIYGRKIMGRKQAEWQTGKINKTKSNRKRQGLALGYCPVPQRETMESLACYCVQAIYCMFLAKLKQMLLAPHLYGWLLLILHLWIREANAALKPDMYVGFPASVSGGAGVYLLNFWVCVLGWRCVRTSKSATHSAKQAAIGTCV